jgi:hypothetical protein
MGISSFWQKIIGFLTPLTPYLRETLLFKLFISIFILGLIAFFLIRGHRRFELLGMEKESLLKRYLIFRGKKHSILRGAQSDQGAFDEIIRSISRSWHKFEQYYTQKTELIKENYRTMRKGLLLGSILLVLNSLREGFTMLAITKLPSGFFAGLFQGLPNYFLVVVGIALLRMQRVRMRGDSPYKIDSALETLVADFDQDDPLLYEEFDPLEEKEREV